MKCEQKTKGKRRKDVKKTKIFACGALQCNNRPIFIDVCIIKNSRPEGRNFGGPF